MMKITGLLVMNVSTHSRAEAAANSSEPTLRADMVSTHSRAEAAACYWRKRRSYYRVSTHSRAEAAAICSSSKSADSSCFNTQPRGGGCIDEAFAPLKKALFQHTAARRRLLFI